MPAAASLRHDPQAGHPRLETPAGLTPDWLTAVLKAGGWLAAGRLQSVQTTAVGNGLLGLNLRLHLQWDLDGDRAGAPRTLVMKLAAAGAESRASGAALGLYRRETRFYQEIAPRLGPALPAVLFADVSDDGAAFTLLFEDLAPARGGDQIAGCTVEDAEKAIDTAADLHAPLWGRPNDSDYPWLQREQFVSLYCAHMAPAVAAIKPRFGALLEPGVIEVAETFAARIVAWFAQFDGPFTIAHHDYRLDNLLFDARGGRTPCAVLDWQTLMPGPGALDIAYFNGSGLLAETRRAHEQRLARRYHARLLANGVADYGWDRCWHDYRFTAAHGFIMAIIGASLTTPTERGDRALSTMVNRHAAQVLDLGTLDLIR